MKVSLVLPMYNETLNVERTYRLISEELDKEGYHEREIIFVNDGSTDDTWEKAKKLAKSHKDLIVLGYSHNQGRGKALRTGFDFVTGDLILTTDFDLSYAPYHLSQMLQYLQEHPQADIILTSCYMPGGKTEGVPRVRLWMSKVGNYFLRQAFSQRIYTSTCVVRGYRREVLKDLVLESRGKEIHLEIISKALATGFQIEEIPGTLCKRQYGSSSFTWRATSFSHILFLVHERPFLLFGLLGLFLVAVGFLSGIIILYARFIAPPSFADTFLGTLISPNFVIILFLSGLQIIGLGFLGVQNNMLKKELFKLQRQVKSK